MIKFSLLGAILCSSVICSAGTPTELENNGAADSQIESEKIDTTRSLASHIGLTTDEAYFATPKETRGSRYLDEKRKDDLQGLPPLMPKETPR